jgi:hypothetical protein
MANTLLSDVFKDLSKTDLEGAASSAIKLEVSIPIFLCKSNEGAPFFLVECTSKLNEIPFALEHITFFFDVSFEVSVENNITLGKFVKISCDPLRWDLHDFFINSIGSILESEEWNLLSPDIDGFLKKIVDLFKPNKTLSEFAVQGLWGELFYIYDSPNKVESLMAWHSSSNDLYDFSYSDSNVEIKTTLNKKRIHIFSFEQLTASTIKDSLISIKLVRTDTGLNILDLAGMLDSGLNQKLRGKLWEQITSIIGARILEAENYKYSINSASSSITRYGLSEILKNIYIEDGLGRFITASITIDLGE